MGNDSESIPEQEWDLDLLGAASAAFAAAMRTNIPHGKQWRNLSLMTSVVSGGWLWRIELCGSCRDLSPRAYLCRCPLVLRFIYT